MSHNFFIFGEAAFFQFRKDEVSVHGHLEASPIRWHDGKLRNILFMFFEDGLRQTDGCGHIASTGAVFEFYYFCHVALPPWGDGEDIDVATAAKKRDELGARKSILQPGAHSASKIKCGMRIVKEGAV